MVASFWPNSKAKNVATVSQPLERVQVIPKRHSASTVAWALLRWGKLVDTQVVHYDNPSWRDMILLLTLPGWNNQLSYQEWDGLATMYPILYPQKTLILPHYDAGPAPLFALVRRSLPPTLTLLGIDEDTALISDAHGWQVAGRSGVEVARAGRRQRYHSGADLVQNEPS
jgi:hypothetical protein